MSRLSIDAAGPGDAPQVGTILSDWVDETPWMVQIHSREEARGHARDMIRNGWVTLACLDGVVAAFLARDGAEIHALYVTRSVCGQGLGKALLEHAKRHSDWLYLWTFQANTRAQAFYEREGFREMLRSDGAGNDEGLPDIRYEWRRHERP